MVDRLLPVWAVFLDDIRQSVRHWAFIAWGALGLLAALVWFVSPHPASGPRVEAAAVAADEEAAPVVAQRNPTAAEFSGRILGAHFLLWAGFVIALGAGAIAAEAEIAPEAILCRGVSRWQYYVAKCAARVTVVTLLFCVLTMLPIGVAVLRLTNDLDFSAALHGLGLGMKFLAALTVIGVAASSWFTNAQISVVVCWMCLYGMGIVVAILEISGLSPLDFSARLPVLLRGDTAVLADHHLLSALLGAALISTVLSLGCYSFRDV